MINDNLRRWNSARTAIRLDPFDNQVTGQSFDQLRRWNTTKTARSTEPVPQVLTAKQLPRFAGIDARHRTVTMAQVVKCEKIEKKDCYTVIAYGPTDNWTVKRRYEEFYTFHLNLLDMFPEEAGKKGNQRIIPRFPGPKAFMSEDVSWERKEALDCYVKDLFSLPERIVHSYWLIKFFAPKECDPKCPVVESTQSEILDFFDLSMGNLPPVAAITSRKSITKSRHCSSPPEPRIIIKAKLSEDIIKVEIPEGSSLASFCKLCERKFSSYIPARFQYLDEDGDEIIISDDDDFMAALKVSAATKPLMLICQEGLENL